jgi:hypothetical protein
MALNFPTNPTLGQIYIEGDRSFIWNGVSWLYKNEYLEIKTAIANAINNAGGSITTSTPFHNYPAAIESLGGGGLTINGVIESYTVKEGETINAGDFVDYINESGSTTLEVNQSVFSTTNPLGYKVKSFLISENKILTFYAEYGYTTSIALFSINGNQVTQIGATHQVADTSAAFYSADKISENKFAIVTNFNSNQAKVYVVSVTNDVITSTASTTMPSFGDTYYYGMEILTISEDTGSGEALVAVFLDIEDMSYYGDGGLRAVLFTVNTSNNSLSTLIFNTVVPGNQSFSYGSVRFSKITNDLVLGYVGSNLLNISINATNKTCSLINTIVVESVNFPDYFRISKIINIPNSNNKYLLAQKGTNYNIPDSKIKSYLYNYSLSNPTTTPMSNEILLKNADLQYDEGVLIDTQESGTFVAIYKNLVVTFNYNINNDTYTILNSTTVSNSVWQEYISAIPVNQNQLFFASFSSSVNYKGLINLPTTYAIEEVFPATDNIFGVAKTSGTGGQTIEVYTNL